MLQLLRPQVLCLLLVLFGAPLQALPGAQGASHKAPKPPLAAAASAPYEHIVAVVDKEVITQGELLAEARLALVMREGEAAATVPLPSDYLSTFKDHLIHQVLVAQEARRMGTDAISDAEVNHRLGQLSAKFSSQRAYLTFLRTLTMDAASVRAVMARDVQNDRYIKERLRTRLLAHSHLTAAGPQPDDVKEEGSVMGNPVAQKILRRWLLELRRGASVRTLDGEGRLRLERH